MSISPEIYEIVSLAARYWFAALGVLIIWRAWRCIVSDNRHAKILRDWTPQTGAIGELLIVAGGGGARRGTRYSLLKECLIGSGRACDISLKSAGVMKRHAIIELREGGLLVSAMHGARVGIGGGELSRQVFLKDGEALNLGGASLRLTLYDAPIPDADALYDVDHDYVVGDDAPNDDNADDEPLTAQEQAFLNQMSASKPRKRR